MLIYPFLAFGQIENSTEYEMPDFLRSITIDKTLLYKACDCYNGEDDYTEVVDSIKYCNCYIKQYEYILNTRKLKNKQLISRYDRIDNYNWIKREYDLCGKKSKTFTMIKSKYHGRTQSDTLVMIDPITFEERQKVIIYYNMTVAKDKK